MRSAIANPKIVDAAVPEADWQLSDVFCARVTIYLTFFKKKQPCTRQTSHADVFNNDAISKRLAEFLLHASS